MKQKHRLSSLRDQVEEGREGNRSELDGHDGQRHSLLLILPIRGKEDTNGVTVCEKTLTGDTNMRTISAYYPRQYNYSHR